nr:hypothetical protein [Cressdnaviricota sp.]
MSLQFKTRFSLTMTWLTTQLRSTSQLLLTFPTLLTVDLICDSSVLKIKIRFVNSKNKNSICQF